MEENKQKRINEIDERIKGLEVHASMWAKAGGRGHMMSMKAYNEIDELKLEKEDLINGTNKLDIYRVENKIKSLKRIREYANIFQKIMYNHEIKNQEEKLKSLKKDKY